MGINLKVLGRGMRSKLGRSFPHPEHLGFLLVRGRASATMRGEHPSMNRATEWYTKLMSGWTFLSRALIVIGGLLVGWFLADEVCQRSPIHQFLTHHFHWQRLTMGLPPPILPS